MQPIDLKALPFIVVDRARQPISLPIAARTKPKPLRLTLAEMRRRGLHYGVREYSSARQGFTLIELMIVVAIFSILAVTGFGLTRNTMPRYRVNGGRISHQ